MQELAASQLVDPATSSLWLAETSSRPGAARAAAAAAASASAGEGSLAAEEAWRAQMAQQQQKQHALGRGAPRQARVPQRGKLPQTEGLACAAQS